MQNKQELTEALFQVRVDGVVKLMEQLVDCEDPHRALSDFLFSVGERQQEDRGLREVIAANHGMQSMTAHRARLIPLADRLLEHACESGRIRADVEATDIPMLLWIAASIATYAADVHPSLWRRYMQILVDGLTAGDADGPLIPPALTVEQLEEITRRQ